MHASSFTLRGEAGVISWSFSWLSWKMHDFMQDAIFVM
jgi:hypothetical protein